MTRPGDNAGDPSNRPAGHQPPEETVRVYDRDAANAVVDHDGLAYGGLTVESLARERHRALARAHDEVLAATPAGQTALNLLMAESVAAALNPQLQRDGAKLVLVRACTGCGCTDDEACDPPCSWATADRCTACPEETS